MFIAYFYANGAGSGSQHALGAERRWFFLWADREGGRRYNLPRSKSTKPCVAWAGEICKFGNRGQACDYWYTEKFRTLLYVKLI